MSDGFNIARGYYAAALHVALSRFPNDPNRAKKLAKEVTSRKYGPQKAEEAQKQYHEGD